MEAKNALRSLGEEGPHPPQSPRWQTRSHTEGRKRLAEYLLRHPFSLQKITG
jgi:hypothetical protein